MSSWSHFLQQYFAYEDLGISLDTSRIGLNQTWLDSMETKISNAFKDMQNLEAGAIANPDEGRMVGHYWLRAAGLAPAKLREEIERDYNQVRTFVENIHSGKICSPSGKPFTKLLSIGIGGSALGPQLAQSALTDHTSPLQAYWFDNTDAHGIDRTLAAIGEELEQTLVLVISKSGGTPETRNGMLEAKAAFTRAGLEFSQHAVAITGPQSKLDQVAEQEQWLERFPMADWVGGRTSIMSVVGLVPMGLLGIDLDQFLAGARDMDAKTRVPKRTENMAMQLALSWHKATNGKGEKDMVVLPYSDQLELFSRYLQQLVMESLGKKADLDGNDVFQGIAVYGNKGSTDQHAYVQQLRDGVANFFATFLEVRQGRAATAEQIEVEPGATSADFLQGFLRGTRNALAEGGRASLTISIAQLNAHSLGMLIALFERAVSFYASLVHINAYHQPGVEAGKKAAAVFLQLLTQVRQALQAAGKSVRAEELASEIAADPEAVWHCLVHIAANDAGALRTPGATPAEDKFQLKP